MLTRYPLAFPALLCAAALSCTPAKAPGSNPGDMTPEGHRAAAQQEREKAAAHEQDKASVGPSKPNMEQNQKALHEQEAQKHRNYAEQHDQAAAAADAGQK